MAGLQDNAERAEKGDTLEDVEINDLDSILKPLGGFGRFQLLNMLCICSIIILCTFSELGYVFTAGELRHRCMIPECERANATYGDEDKPWLAAAVAMGGSGKYDSCHRYQYKYNDTDDFSDQCSSELFDTNETFICSSFVYDTDEWTIHREDWGPHCYEEKYKLGLVGSINNAGQVVGGIFAGYIQDRYGRKVVLVTLTLVVAVVGAIKSFAVNYAMMLSMEALESMAAVALYNGPFVMALEIVDPSNRVMAGTMVCMAYPAGEALLGLVQYLTFNWRNTLRICYMPFFLAVSFYWIVPESVRWLLAAGHTEEVVTVLKKIARFNGTKFPEAAVEKMLIREAAIAKEAKLEERASRRGVRDLWSSKIMRKRTICIHLLWVCVMFVYFAMTMNSVGVSDNKFTDFIMTGLVEVPGYLFVFFVVDRLGRKKTAGGLLLLCAVACVSAAFLSDDLSWLRLTLYLIGKFAASGAVFACDVFTTELFPTFVRSTILTTSLMCGKIATIVAPEIPLLDDIYKPLPLLIFSGMAVLGALAVLPFPETLGTQLPETIEDAENQEKHIEL